MQLDMAKQQREMMITSQAAQMSADAQQHKMQIEMQQKMVPAFVSFDLIFRLVAWLSTP